MASLHSHSHTQPKVGEEKGIILRWAGAYHTFFGWFLRGSEPNIVKLAGIKPGDKVLDVACGPGSLTLTAKGAAGMSGQVYGLDASEEMIAFARQQAIRKGQPVDFQVGLAQALPFETGTFDVVISRLAIHHLPGDLKDQAFGEIFRVLKPGGNCLIVDFEPTGLPLRGLFGIGGQHNPMMAVNVRNYLPLLEKSGFKKLNTGPTSSRILAWAGGQKPGATAETN